MSSSSATSGQNITNLANVRPATDESYYNVRGERIAIAQHTQYAFGTVADTVRAFAYDGNGQIISRRDGTANGNTIDQGVDPSLKNQHYVYVNGQQVAHYDEKTTLDVLSQVTAFSSGTGAGDYVVQEGDTLKSIAQAVYGNASLWYIVAQANVLTGDNDLAVGLSLSIPAVTTTRNDATTFKPYNPSEIQGSTTPDLPVIAPPPPPPKHHCNVIAAVIVIAVVVVASIVTAGAAAAAFGTTLAGTIGTAAATAAAGSAAGQLAGDALGTHQGFSFGEVFTSAATAAVTAGVGYFVSGASSAAAAVQSGTEAGQGASTVAQGISWSRFGAQAAEAAEGYVAQAGAAKLVGQPSHFSWAGLVSTSLAGGVSSLVGPSQQEVQVGQVGSSSWRAGVSTFLGGAVQREVSRSLGDDHTASWEQIAERSAGTALAVGLVGAMQKEPASREDFDGHVNELVGNELVNVGSDIEASAEANLQGYFAATNGQASTALDAQLGVYNLGSGNSPSFDAYSVSRGSEAPTGQLSYLDGLGTTYDPSSNIPLARYLVRPDNGQADFAPTTPTFAVYHSEGSNGNVTSFRLYDNRSQAGVALESSQIDLLNEAFGGGRNASYGGQVSAVDGDINVTGVEHGSLDGRLISDFPAAYVSPEGTATTTGSLGEADSERIALDAAMRANDGRIFPSNPYGTPSDMRMTSLINQQRDVRLGSALDRSLSAAIAREALNNPYNAPRPEVGVNQIRSQNLWAEDMHADPRVSGAMVSTPDDTEQRMNELMLRAATDGGVLGLPTFLVAAKLNPGNVQAIESTLELEHNLTDMMGAHVALRGVQGSIGQGGRRSVGSRRVRPTPDFERLDDLQGPGSLGRVRGDSAARLRAELDRLAAEGHAIERHGGAITDDQLMVRARTGVAPDGSTAPRGRTPDSTAFYTDDHLVAADQFLRQNYLNTAIVNAAPGQIRLKLSADIGIPVGRGFLPVGRTQGIAGPLLKVDNISNVEAWYVLDTATNVWQTNTIYPRARP